ncbi:MAG: hypothetical protein ACJ78Q_01300 [Chloroflexia bacterium]
MAAEAPAQVQKPVVPFIRRSRSVWFVLFTSMVLFCAVCSASGVGLYGYLQTVTRPRGAILQLVRGTQLSVVRHTLVDPEAVQDTTSVNEGDRITAGDDTEANMRLFDESVVDLYFGAHVALTTLRSGRFFSNAKEINISVDSGTAEISTPDLGPYSSASYTVQTPHALVDLQPDSTVRVQFDGQGDTASTQVILVNGAATVLAAGKEIPLQINTMVVCGPEGCPDGTQTAEQELIRNGDFTLPPASGAETLEEGGLGTRAWSVVALPPRSSTPDVPPVQVVTETLKTQSLRAAVIRKSDSDLGYATYGIHQDINAPASFFKQIKLRAQVKVVAQTAPVGGPPLAEVYPITIKINYTDSKRQQQQWRHSFYWSPIDLKLPGATHVVQGSWEPQEFTLKSLGALAGEAPTSVPQASPTAPGTSTPELDAGIADISVINSIEITGVGTGFQSWITGISIVAR